MRCRLIGVVVLALLAQTSRARADEGRANAGDATPAAPATSNAPTPRANAIEREPSFDNAPLAVRHQRVEYGLQVSKIRSRISGADPWQNGLDITASLGLSPRVPWLRLAGFQAFVFRAFDSKSFSVTPFFQGLEGGVKLGFLELGASVGVSAVSVDIAHTDWSVGFLQPRTSALAGLSFRDVHLRALAFSEYYWRWVGRDSALVQGLGIQLIIGVPAR
ncbi:hypothetical protein AKJ09_05726 [Labilithrix luteola]|uniref:Outer membrane protein beta-barrel domain-containing protein n=1 Tax=Labilithrix luteola TaxID=1391654 RepID=A0A0K1PZY9_9BACT|nr:hypothetical protein [Labilithrix luteola]AKU99062.1 hypothetical protein AKJ09_05726 [Labilithrix luteola]